MQEVYLSDEGKVMLIGSMGCDRVGGITFEAMWAGRMQLLEDYYAFMGSKIEQ